VADDIWNDVPAHRHVNRAALSHALDVVRDARSRFGKPTRVLDLGCGDGAVTAELAKDSARVTGVDISRDAIERARAAHPQIEFETTESDEPLPFGDAAFDAVVCLNVLEHVADTQHFLSEARRVLVPEGLLGLTVPFHGVLKNVVVALRSFERHHDPLEPVLRFYTRRSVARLLEEFGFENVRVTAAGGMPYLRETLLARASRGAP
jgi:2-polyprenyl-6-hydroxyphenyl methylase/3-demethylubiquinone-9 3-methyltransferase